MPTKSDIQKMTKELELARIVQRGMMPSTLPNAQNMDLASVYIPADMVGGDFYDVLITRKRKIALLIFDVSGHGVAAALVGAMCKMLFTNYIEQDLSPAEVFKRVNTDISNKLSSGHYLTAFLGIIDPSSNTMTYSRGGHTAPLLFRHRTGEVIELEGSSMFIGHPALKENATYFEDSITLFWHDKLVLYTDGLTEATDPDENMYGIERLIEKTKASGHLNPDLFVKRVIADNEEFRKAQTLEDDLTLLCIRIGCSQSIIEESGFSVEDSPGVLVMSDIKEIEPNASVILRELDKSGLPAKMFFSAHMCIHEMLDNALRHGNKLDPGKKVFLLYKVTMDKFTISVVDQGEGFNFKKLPDPHLPENTIKDHGRGLYLVMQYMDEVEFNEKGNRIKVIKHI